MAQQPQAGQGLLIIETSPSHSDTPNSVGLLWRTDQPIAETSTWQHTTITSDRQPCPGGIRTRRSSNRAAADPRLRPRGHSIGSLCIYCRLFVNDNNSSFLSHLCLLIKQVDICIYVYISIQIRKTIFLTAEFVDMSLLSIAWRLQIHIFPPYIVLYKNTKRPSL
jgi:hypothetical protein